MNRISAPIAASLCLAATASLAAPQLFASSDTIDSDIQSRIVGGSDVDISLAPATVALISNVALANTGSYFQSQFCAGTVIADRWVLTAAHCLMNDGESVDGSQLSVLMGSTDLENPVNQTVGVTRVITHEQYDAASQANDIALLELEYDSLVAPATLDTEAIELNDEALIFGWGALNMGSDTEQQLFPSVLQGASVRLIPGEECGTLFPAYDGSVDARNLCAGVPAGGVDSCQGDSGGPLYRYQEGEQTATRVTGVVSWGFGCALPDAPGVYTRVSAFSSWIAENAETGTISQPPVVDDEPVNDDFVDTDDTTEEGDNGDAVDVGEEESGEEENLTLSEAASAAGSSGYFMLLGLGGLTVLRRTRSKKLLAGAAVSLVCGASSAALAQSSVSSDLVVGQEATASVSTDKLNVATLSQTQHLIGESREAVMGDARNIWNSEPACNIIRTGSGKSRRAFFLETCAFANTSAVTLCEATPEWVEYRFLENTLVQVAFDFDTLNDEERYDNCVSQQVSMNAGDTDISVLNDQYSRTTVSDSNAVDQLHWTGKSSRNAMQ